MIHLLIGLLLYCFGVAAYADISLSLIPARQSVTFGSPTLIDIFVSGLTGGTAGSVGAFDLNVTFDSSRLSFQSTAFGNQLDVFGLGDIQSASRVSANIINLSEVSLDSPLDLASHQANSFRLATLTFLTTSIGDSALGLSLNALSDANGGPLTATLVPADITISPVPEPSAFALAIVGLVGVAAAARRKSFERSAT